MRLFVFFKNVKNVANGLAILSFVGSSLAFSAEVEVPVGRWENSSVIPNEELKVGDRIKVEAVVSEVFSSEQRVKYRVLSEGEKKDPYEYGFFIQDLTVNSQGIVALSMAPVKSGELILPSMEIYEDSSGEEKILLRTQPYTIQVKSSGEQKEKVPEILPPFQLNVPLVIWLGLFVLAVLVIALVVFVFIKLSRRKGNKAPFSPVQKPRLSPDVEAVQRMLSLEGKRLWEQKKYKPHYFELSEIIKDYLGRRFEFNALESTSKEVLDFLSSQKEKLQLSEETLRQLEVAFEKMDRVKFTDLLPPEKEPEGLIAEMKSWVKETKKEEEKDAVR